MRNENKHLNNNWKILFKPKGDSDVGHKDLQQIWDHSDRYGHDFEPNVEMGLQKLKNRIAQDTTPAHIIPLRRRWMRIAAALLFFSFATIATYKYLNNTDSSTPLAWIDINTTDDEQRSVTLPDGSVVTLNEHSHLSYAADLNTSPKRLIKLSGEAFFDVQRRPEQAFLITTSQSEIEVLGTSFNVRAYADEAATEVEVSTGRVAFRDHQHEKSSILEANQVAILDKDNDLIEMDAPALNRKAWKTGLLSFKETKMTAALPLIERYYGIRFINNANLSACTISGEWSNEKLEDVLELIEHLSGGGLRIDFLSDGVYKVTGRCD